MLVLTSANLGTISGVAGTGKQPGGYNISGPQMDRVLLKVSLHGNLTANTTLFVDPQEKHLNFLGSIIGARDPNLGLSIVGYYLSLKKMNKVMTTMRLMADFRNATATFKDYFETKGTSW